MLFTVVFPAPPSVSPNAPVIEPALLIVSVPASELIRVALPSVMSPAKLFAPLIFRKAPSVATPVPFSVSGSASVMMLF